MFRTALLSLTAFLFLSLSSSNALIPNGSSAPDFTVTDINGVTHRLSDYTNAGKMVVIDFFATWCGPCWNYHQTHALADLYNFNGPNGSDQVMVFGLEVDLSTNEACLYGQAGCNDNNPWGDWTAGVPYPIVNVTNASIPNGYSISYYPTIATICSDMLIYESGQVSSTVHETWIASCNFDGQLESVGDVGCFEDQDGHIDVSYLEGHGSVYFNWSNGENTEDLSDLAAGNYSVTMTEANGRKVILSDIVVGGPVSPLLVLLDQSGNIDCHGNSNGFIEVAANGGTASYSYNWNTGDNSQDLYDIPAGNYELTVTDFNGCTKGFSHVITEPAPLTLTTETSPENCDNEDGSILCFAGGGSPAYTYDIGNGPTAGGAFLNLPAGAYDVTLTDVRGCELTQPAVVGFVPAPDAEAGPEKNLDCTQTSVVLDGSGTSGGNVSIEWTTNAGNILEGEHSLTPLVDAAGLYTLTITNLDNGCSTEDVTAVFFSGNLPEADAGPDRSIDCAQMEALLDGSGSSQGPNFEYEWSTVDGNIVDGVSSLQATVDQPGTYTLQVTNTINGCEETSEAIVDSDTDSPEIVFQQVAILNCANTQVQIDASGSSEGADFSYQWTTVDGNIMDGHNSLNPTVDQPGTYSLSITDQSNACSSVGDIDVERDVEYPNADAGGTRVLNCGESELLLDGSGSSMGQLFEYQWTTADGNIVAGSDSIVALVNEAGTYWLRVLNVENACESMDSAILELDQNAPVADAGPDKQINCQNPVVHLNGESSDQGSQYTYLWTTDDGFILDGTDSIVAAVNAPGLYTLTVFDNSNNCSATSSVEVTEFLDEPVAHFGWNSNGLTITLTDSSAGGSIDWQWDFGDGMQNTTSSPSHQYTQAGTYEVCLTVENECGTDMHCQSITVSPLGISIDAGIGHVSCHSGQDGYIDIEILSGNDPLVYNWADGNTEQIRTDLSAGTYELTITDADNVDYEFAFEITQPDVIEVYDVQLMNHSGDTLGSIDLNVRGGTSPYFFEWSNGAQTEDLDGLEEGDYELTITDANLCERVVGPFHIETVTPVIGNIPAMVSFTSTPNPAANFAVVQLSFDRSLDCELRLLDINGHALLERKLSGQELQTALDLGELQAGLYLLQLRAEGGMALRKLIIR